MPTGSPIGSMLSVLDVSTRSRNFTNQFSQSVHDALWALSSQYMLGQFKGEDAGSALFARVHYDTRRLNRFKSGNENTAAIDGTVPIDVLIERQEIKFDLGMEIQLGNYWKKLVKKAGFQEDIEHFLTHFPIHLAETPHERTNPAESELRKSLSGRCINGGSLLAFILEYSSTAADELETLIYGEDPVVNTYSELVADFLDYVKDLYGLDYMPNTSWDASRLEYTAKCSYPLNTAGMEQQTLVADEYNGTGLEWYSFDRSDNNSEKIEGVSVSDAEDIASDYFEVVPNPVTFKSMPTDRWWQIHDSRTNMLRWNNERSDILGTLMKDFAVTFNRDWCQLPFVVEAGNAVEIKHLIVKDVFGDYHYVGGNLVSESAKAEKWDVFKLNKKGSLLDTTANAHFCYPQRIMPMEGEAIEKISLQRDEMANMCWAVELRIPDNIGDFQDADAASVRLLRYIADNYYTVELIGHSEDIYRYGETEDYTYDILRYMLLNPVPENWIPFIPQKTEEESEEINFRRATFKRLIRGMKVKDDPEDYDEYIRPRTSILRHGLDESTPEPYFIKEEEIPVTGVLVTKKFKRARWHDGSVHVWLCNQKVTGRGDMRSNVSYDTVAKKYDNEYRSKIINEYIEPEYLESDYTT